MKTMLKRFLVLLLYIIAFVFMYFWIPFMGIFGGIILGIYWVFTGNDVEKTFVELIIPFALLERCKKKILE